MFGAADVSLKPGIDPLRLDADRSAASDACVMQLAPLAGSVDRVAAHTGVFGAFATVNQVFMVPPRGPSRAQKQVVMGITRRGAPAMWPARCQWGARALT